MPINNKTSSLHSLVMVFYRSVLKSNPDLTSRQRETIYETLTKIARHSYIKGKQDAGQ